MSEHAKLHLGALALALWFAGVLPARGAIAPATTPAVAATDPALASAEIPLVGRDAAAVTVPSAATAWGGARTGSEPTLSDRVVDYHIAATLDPVKHTVDGLEHLSWRNRSAVPVHAVYLHLYLNAFESNYSTYFTESRVPGFRFRSDVPTHTGEWGHIEVRKAEQGGKPITMTFVHPDGGPTTDHTVVRFDLPTAVAPGATTVLDISFFDQLPRVVARTGYFGTFHLIGQWYPKIAVLELPGERGATAPRWNAHEFHLHSEFFSDYGNFDVQMTVPKGFVVGATGEETGAPVEQNGLVTHHFVQGDVHEFAWTADSRSAPPLEGVYRGAGSPEVKVRVIYPPEYAYDAQPVLQATIDSLKFFSETLGPYPYRTATAIIPPYNADEAGGMEYPTFFTTAHVEDTAPDTFGRVILDFVTIHEFGHGYFYGILGSNEFEEPILDEGLNEFWDWRMVALRNQRIHFTSKFWKFFGWDPSADAFEAERAIAGLTHPADPVGENSWKRFDSTSYGETYSRTATAMRDLEHQLGTPVLEKAFADYYARWKFRHPSVADFEQSLIDSSGQPEKVKTIFDQEIYGAVTIDDAVESIETREVLPLPGTHVVNGKWVEETSEELDKRIEEERKAFKKDHPDAKTGPYPYMTTVNLKRYGAPVSETLLVKFADGSSEKVTWDDAKNWNRYSWTKPSPGVSAELDPEHLHNLDANRLNNSMTVHAEGDAAKADKDAPSRLSAASRWTSEVAFIFQSFIAALTTL
jgi:hypothetical protein